jgi:hypothetical protein
MKPQKRMVPRAPLTTDRRTGGAHRLRRELSAREEVTLRLNELHADNVLDVEEVRSMMDDFGLDDENDYWDYLLEKLETTDGGY